MIIVTSFLVFMLVHGPAVCNELYPISVVQDLAQNQPEWSSDNDIELLDGKTYDATFLASHRSTLNQQDLDWIKTYISDEYKFVKDTKEDKWKQQPDFKGVLGTSDFAKRAGKVKAFFARNNKWETTKTTESCTNLLHITAARYLLVTQILYVESGSKLIPCERSVDGKKIVIPDSGVCYPAPYGSATCTSDYDVGLIGKDSGYLTEKFNNYFQSGKGFGKPSELVFDTNVYAFTLEYAMPFYFEKLPAYFADEVAKKEQTYNFKMQELASAYYKVFKYNGDFFNTLKTAGAAAMDATTASLSKKALSYWLGIFSTLHKNVKMRVEDFSNSPEQLRIAHNAEYQRLVKKMSQQHGYKPDLLGTLAKALIYAAEAYHTRGAIRHIVGGTQMKVIDLSFRTPLSVNDLWVSMIENWGESNKEYNHCKTAPLVKCFLKMSKYMWRVFNAMRLVRARLPTKARLKGVVRFGEQFGDPEHAMAMWLAYKRRGAAAIPDRINDVKSFLLQFGCDQAVLNMQKPIPPACLAKMNDKINDYNKALASLMTDSTTWQGR